MKITSLKNKLHAGGALLLIVFVVTAFIVSHSMTDLREARQMESQIASFDNSLSQSKQHFIQFTHTKQQAHYQNFKKSIESLVSEIPQVVGFMSSKGQMFEDINPMESINRYEGIGDSLYKKNVTRGLGKEPGLIRELDELSKALENKIDEANSEPVMLAFLMCRQFEKNYRLHGEENDISLLENHIKTLKAKVLENSLDLGLIAQADAYLLGFKSIVKIDKSLKDLGLDFDKAHASNEIWLTGLKQSEVVYINSLLEAQESKLSWIGLVLFLFLLFLGYGILTRIIHPIIDASEFAQKIADGDLSQSIEIKTDDEMGTLNKNLNQMVHELRSQLIQVEEVSSKIIKGSDTLSQSSQLLQGQSVEVQNQTDLMLSSLMASKAKVSETSTSTHQMNQSIKNITVSISEMSGSLNEVAQNCQKEASIAQEANEKLQHAQAQLAKLDDSTEEISNIITTITNIAKKTNLLALNATIEASAAGDAGRGFAVVAQEVKGLATQTSGSTTEIKSIVENIQNMVENSVNSIEDIVSSIQEVNSISHSIVASVEEQSSTMNEIADNVGEVSNNSGLISKNMELTSTDIHELSGKSETVQTSVKDSSVKVQDMEGVIQLFSNIVEELKQSTAKFKL